MGIATDPCIFKKKSLLTTQQSYVLFSMENRRPLEEHKALTCSLCYLSDRTNLPMLEIYYTNLIGLLKYGTFVPLAGQPAKIKN